ncbi:MAG: hypothetical protein QXI89_01165, partial [Candidatus Anstonellales archaeon]
IMIEQGNERVSEIAEHILGFDYDTFSKAVYAEQNALESLLNARPSERKMLIDRLLGIDKIQEAAKKAKTVSNQLRAHYKALYEQASTFRTEEKIEELNKIKKQIQELADNISKDIEYLKKLENEFNEIKKERAEMLKNREWHNELLSKQKQLEGKMAEFEGSYKKEKENEIKYNEIKTMLDGLKEKQKLLEEKIKRQENRLRNAYEMYLHLNKELKDKITLKSNLDKIIEKISLYDAKAMQENMDNINKIIIDKQSTIKSLFSEIKKAEIAIEHLKNAKKGRCPTCNTELGKEGIEVVMKFWISVIKESNAKMEKEKEELSRLMKKKQEIEKDMNNYKSLEEQKAMISEKLNSVKVDEEQVNNAKQNYNNEKEEFDRIKKEISEILEKVNVLEKDLYAIDIKLKEAKAYKAYEKDKILIENQIKEIAFDDKKLDGLNEAYSNKLKALSAVQERIKANKEKFETFTSMAARIEKELNENIKREKKIKRLEKLANDFAIIEQALEQYQTLRRDSIIEALNSAIASFWQILYPYKDYVSAFISIDEDGDYRFYVSNGKEHKLLDTVASGGERAVYALALRMSLSFILSKRLRWLILDEPTHNLDDAGVEALKYFIREQISDSVEQLFIITHDERLKDTSLGKVFLFTRKDDKKEKTEVSVIA